MSKANCRASQIRERRDLWYNAINSQQDLRLSRRPSCGRAALSLPSLSGKGHTTLGNKLYVGNLDTQITSDDLTQLFTGAGRVVSARVITDRDTGRSKGFAFIEMANDAEALQAIALYNRHPLHEQALIVNEARPSESQGGNAQSPTLRPKFREVKHKRRGGADRHRFR